MALSQLSVSVLLPTLVLLLYWTTSALSHVPTANDPSPLAKVKRSLPSRTTEEGQAALQVAKDSLSVVKEVFGKIDASRLSVLMQSMVNVVSLAPGVGALSASVINMALAFFPQDNPLNQLEEKFDEVNTKLAELDVMSREIWDLGKEIPWNEPEMAIAFLWSEFNDFRKSSALVGSEEEKRQRAKKFTDEWKLQETEDTVEKLYHYLTVSTTSPSGHLISLLSRKYKCGVPEIAKYSMFFNSLLWRGMVLNQLYWSLSGFNPSVKAAEQAKKLQEVSKAQVEAVKSCLNDYQTYVNADVKEISERHSPDDKKLIATEIKEALDRKYIWYNWVVVVYNTEQRYSDTFDGFTIIPVGKITVAVGGTNKGEVVNESLTRDKANSCLENQYCADLFQKVRGPGNCGMLPYYNVRVPYQNYKPGPAKHLFLTDYAKLMHISYEPGSVEVPAPFYSRTCWWYLHYTAPFSFYYSRDERVCIINYCQNDGKCDRLLDSNEWLCDCPDGYYGNMCQNSMDFSEASRIDASQTLRQRHQAEQVERGLFN